MIKTTPEALDWLRTQSKRVRFGRDTYIEIVQVILNLLEDARQLRAEIARLQKALEPKPKPKRHPTEGDGTWDLPRET